MDNETFTLGSFEYSTRLEMESARSEQAKIERLDAQLNYENPAMVYSVYTKIIDRNMLKSPEGLLYLLRLQSYLDENQKTVGKEIPAVPIGSFLLTEANSDKTNVIESVQKATSKKTNAVSGDLKEKVLVYRLIIAFLVVAIIVMLGISMASNSPNIINYRKQIENEYADWEMKLNEKEQELNERERSLNEY